MIYDRYDLADHYNYIDGLSDEELAKAIRDLDYWDLDLNRELVWRADKLVPGLFERYLELEGEGFEPILEKSADVLNVEIY